MLGCAYMLAIDQFHATRQQHGIALSTCRPTLIHIHARRQDATNHAGMRNNPPQPLQIAPGRDRASAPIHAGPHRRQSTGRGIARPGQTACRMKGKARNAPSICCSLLSKNVHLLRMLQGRPYMLELSKREIIWKQFT